MHRYPICASVICLCFGGVVRGDVIFASTDYKPQSSASQAVVGNFANNTKRQILASGFHLDQPVHVTSIGGDLGSGNGRLFAEIIQLVGPRVLPASFPFSPEEVLLHTLLPAYPVYGARVPVSIDLAPGDYALVFGSGMFGVEGDGGMYNGNTNNPEAYFFSWHTDRNSWASNNGGTYFLVEGNVIPEPTALSCAVVTGLGFLLISRRCDRLTVTTNKV